MPNGIDRASSLIEYLQRLATLRSRPVRNVRTYEKVLWLSDCPHEKGVFTQAWGHDEEHDQEKWLEVRYRQEPELPAVPTQCKEWVNHESLRSRSDYQEPELPAVPLQCQEWVSYESLRNKNDLPKLLPEITQQIANPDLHQDLDQPETIPQTKHLENHAEVEQIWDRYVEDEWLSWTERHNAWERDHLPKLLPEITRQIPNPNWHENSNQPKKILKTECLDDHSQVQQKWDSYVKDRWLPWAREHDAWRRLHKVYSELFAIHLMQDRLGEEYELVLGLGLLTWQTPAPARQHVRRHLVVADALLEFEADLPKFTIRPHTEGAKLRPELDMLDIEEQPPNAEIAAREGLVAAEDDPWERGCVESTLQALVHSIDSQGEYDRSLEVRVVDASEQPIVQYAPALILRKRSTKSLTETLKQISEQIENDDPIPHGFAELAEIHDNPEETNTNFDGEIFFPLLSNDEQRSIVDKIEEANGVLVQGPPGTGKSHTIANLICHLLATGRRILITAKKPHALQVLEELLPKQLRPLCINLLGKGPQELDALEKSVEGILNKMNEMTNWKKNDAKQKCKENENRLHTLRKKKIEINRQIRAIRESETKTETIAEGAYQGTAAKIAETVNQNRSKYDWFTDFIPWNKDMPHEISTNHLQNVIADLHQFTPEMRGKLNLAWPQTLPSLEHFVNLVQNETSATQEELSMAHGADERLTELLAKNDLPVIKAIRNAFLSFRDARRGLSIAAFPWVSDAVQDVLDGNPNLWRTRLSVTSNVIEEIRNFIETADETAVEVPDTHNIIKLREDACKLRIYMEAGGKLGWWLFRSKTVRDRLYVIKDAKINGHLCSTVEHFTNLVDALNVRIQCEQAWSFWTGQNERTENPYALQLATLRSLHDALEKVLALEERVNKCREAINQHPDMDEPTWADEAQIETIICSCRLALARINRQRAREEIDNVESFIYQVVDEHNAHPITNNLLNAIRNRDMDEFAQCASNIENLKEQYQDLQNMDESLSQLRNELPELTESMETTYDKPHWEERIQCIGDAWRWGQARHWIEDYINKENVPKLNKRAKRIENNIKKIIAELASLRAWSFCFSRLDKYRRQHMIEWQQTIENLGGGTGKYAARDRRKAQEHLNECREAVPAWVMPLYRVWDTVKPAPEIFDVIIVDEASQCGFEALPLFYLAQKIVIVGDDKQIRPEAVGVKRQREHQLMRDFLYDFQFRNSFSTSRSLFDHGRRLYVDQQITLCDHFRCMPEIIEFSNRLCYSNTPLLPLREYGSDRLPPLKRVFVDNGYCEGIGNQIINRPEAEAIVEKIAMMCDCEEYNAKTMGVVVLQGDAQVRLIQSQLFQHLKPTVMKERRLVCGNPSSFQGDQRDIMFLSLVVARNENDERRFRALTDKATRRRFNVAASRAKDQMILFHSVTLDDLTNPRDLRRKLLEFFQNMQPQHIAQPRQIAGIPLSELEDLASQSDRQIGNQPQPFGSWFEVDVALELLHMNFIVHSQYEVANRRIDLVVEGRHSKLAIECDGDYWHDWDDANRYDDDMERQRQLENLGWEFFRVRESAFRYNKENTLAKLQQALEDRGIFPDHGVTEPHGDDTDRDGLNDSGDATENEDEDAPSADAENEGGQLRHPLEAITEEEIQKAIISALSKCPNQSCTLKSVTKLVLRELNRQTRGQPRLEFGRRVMQNVDALEEQGRIKKYQATNERIKLINSTAQSG